MKLQKAQKEATLAWIAEGLESDEINQRAAEFEPPFSVLRSQVDYYRKTRAIEINAIRAAGEHDALNHGLAQKAERVKLLKRLAAQLTKDLLGDDPKIWTENAKSVGLERYNYLEFNKAEIDSLRGILDDISSEVGGRVRKAELSGPGGAPLNPAPLPFDLSALTDDEYEAWKALYQKASQAKTEKPQSEDEHAE